MVEVTLRWNIQDEAGLSDLMDVIALTAKINTIEAPEAPRALSWPSPKPIPDEDEQQPALPPGVPGAGVETRGRRGGRPKGAKNKATLAAEAAAQEQTGEQPETGDDTSHAEKQAPAPLLNRAPSPTVVQQQPAMPAAQVGNGADAAERELSHTDIQAKITALSEKGIGNATAFYIKVLKAPAWPSDKTPKPSWFTTSAITGQENLERCMTELFMIEDNPALLHSA
jgi:hypothetical protein